MMTTTAMAAPPPPPPDDDDNESTQQAAETGTGAFISRCPRASNLDYHAEATLRLFEERDEDRLSLSTRTARGLVLLVPFVEEDEGEEEEEEKEHHAEDVEATTTTAPTAQDGATAATTTVDIPSWLLPEGAQSAASGGGGGGGEVSAARAEKGTEAATGRPEKQRRFSVLSMEENRRPGGSEGGSAAVAGIIDDSSRGMDCESSGSCCYEDPIRELVGGRTAVSSKNPAAIPPKKKEKLSAEVLEHILSLLRGCLGAFATKRIADEPWDAGGGDVAFRRKRRPREPAKIPWVRQVPSMPTPLSHLPVPWIRGAALESDDWQRQQQRNLSLALQRLGSALRLDVGRQASNNTVVAINNNSRNTHQETATAFRLLDGILLPRKQRRQGSFARNARVGPRWRDQLDRERLAIVPYVPPPFLPPPPPPASLSSQHRTSAAGEPSVWKYAVVAANVARIALQLQLQNKQQHKDEEEPHVCRQSDRVPPPSSDTTETNTRTTGNGTNFEKAATKTSLLAGKRERHERDNSMQEESEVKEGVGGLEGRPAKVSKTSNPEEPPAATHGVSFSEVVQVARAHNSRQDDTPEQQPLQHNEQHHRSNPKSNSKARTKSDENTLPGDKNNAKHEKRKRREERKARKKAKKEKKKERKQREQTDKFAGNEPPKPPPEVLKGTASQPQASVDVGDSPSSSQVLRNLGFSSRQEMAAVSEAALSESRDRLKANSRARREAFEPSAIARHLPRAKVADGKGFNPQNRFLTSANHGRATSSSESIRPQSLELLSRIARGPPAGKPTEGRRARDEKRRSLPSNFVSEAGGQGSRRRSTNSCRASTLPQEGEPAARKRHLTGDGNQVSSAHQQQRQLNQLGPSNMKPPHGFHGERTRSVPSSNNTKEGMVSKADLHQQQHQRPNHPTSEPAPLFPVPQAETGGRTKGASSYCTLPPIQVLCSENFLHTWSDIAAELGSGRWSILESDAEGQKIEAIDGLVDDVDLELSNRGGIIIYSASAFTDDDDTKAIVTDTVTTVATGKFNQLFIFICYDVSLSSSIVRNITQVQTSCTGANLPTSLFFKTTSPKSLSASIAATVFSTSRKTPDPTDMLPPADAARNRHLCERARFIRAVIPLITAAGAIQCLQLIQRLAPKTNSLALLCTSQKLRDDIASAAAPEIHPDAMALLTQALQAPLSGA